MNLYGILGHYLPAFGAIVGQMQHDLFHVYTVDEHILMVIRNLRRFTEAQHAHEYPLCSRLIADFERKEVLYLAGLFHDIAKGRGGDHSTLGARDAQRFCAQHGLSTRRRRARRAGSSAEHLTMSLDRAEAGHHRSRRRRRVRRAGRRRAPADRALPAHRRRHPRHESQGVERLEGQAARGPVPRRRARRSRRERASARSTTASRSASAKRIGCCGFTRCPTTPSATLWRELDTLYFQRHTADEIAWHARHLYWRVDGDEPVVKVRLAREGAGLQALVYLPDQKALFARICGFFGRAGLSILDAKVHTTRHGYALDTFALHDPANPNASYRETIQFIEYELTRALTTPGAAEPPAKAAFRASCGTSR